MAKIRWGPLLGLALFLIAPPVAAQQLTFCVDVPSDLGGGTYLPNQSVYFNGSTYSLSFNGAGLGADVHIDAIEILSGDCIVFSADAPFTAGATTYGPSDLVKYCTASGTYSLYKSAASLGLSVAADIDALYIDGSANLYFSFDAPETVGATTYDATDIAKWDGASLTKHFSGSTSGVPSYANVIGFAISRTSDNTSYFSFDVPTTIGSYTFVQGDVAIHWTSPDLWSETPYYRDASFPKGSLLSDFFLPLPPPPPVGDGDVVPEDPLLAQRNGPARIDVTYSRRCRDYQGFGSFHLVYGSISTVSTYAVTDAICNDAFDTNGDGLHEWNYPPDGNIWFLVLGDDLATSEGSWGFDYIGGTKNQRNGMQSSSHSGKCGMTAKDVTNSTCPWP